MSGHGILLINVGTPDSPQAEDVGRYLSQFLMDPYVVDIPAPLRWFFVKQLIVPRRKHASGKLYQKIWSSEGSPLLVHTHNLTEKLRELFSRETPVEYAMRYGTPSISSAIQKFKGANISKLCVVPLYPQYSLSATKTAEVEVTHWARKYLPSVHLRFLPPFYQSEPYLSAVESVSRRYLEKIGYDYALFSFHGLPERQIRKTDVTGSHCLEKENCCDESVNPLCYRSQSFWTARTLATRLGIPPSKYSVAFQSRLGRTPWIRPYTDEFYRLLPAQGIKRLVVLCPSFVADCLETLEEVQIRGKEEFVRHGGEELTLIPSLNAEPEWIQGIKQLIETRMNSELPAEDVSKNQRRDDARI